MKTSRRKARQDALKILFQQDMNSGKSTEEGLLHFESCFSNGKEEELDAFTDRLVRGVTTKMEEIDAELRNISENWRLERMAAVDRNILRLGIFELKLCDDIPATVTINEMVELAKEFGAEDSPSFVNGVLDKIRKSLNCPNKAP